MAIPDENGNILGFVFNDLDTDGIRDPGEVGLPGFTVFIDANENGLLDAGDIQAITASNGAFFFSDVEPGLHRIDIHIETGRHGPCLVAADVAGRRVPRSPLGAGGTVAGVSFGVENRADGDWGDLPDSYSTTARVEWPERTPWCPASNSAAAIDGEVNGLPEPGADGDDAGRQR